MKEIVVSAPGKLMLMGDHAVVYGRPCLVAAVEQRLKVAIARIDREKLVVSAPGVGIKFWSRSLAQLGRGEVPEGARFIVAAVQRFLQKEKVSGGLRIKTGGHFSAEYGFGSSAAVTVGVMMGLCWMFNKELSRKDLFKECYQVVLEVQGVGSGFDVAAALFGGVLYFRDEGKVVEKLPIKGSRLPVVVGYTGVKADTVALVRRVAERRRRQKNRVEGVFDRIAELTERGRGAIENQDWQQWGRLMNANQQELEKLGVSSLKLDRLIKVVREAGAWGAKLSGAGGGDCMMAVIEEKGRDRVEAAIEAAGGKVVKVKLGGRGVKVI